MQWSWVFLIVFPASVCCDTCGSALTSDMRIEYFLFNESYFNFTIYFANENYMNGKRIYHYLYPFIIFLKKKTVIYLSHDCSWPISREQLDQTKWVVIREVDVCRICC